MIELDGYQISECVEADAGREVYAAIRSEDSADVIIKVWPVGCARARDTERAILAVARGHGVQDILDDLEVAGRPALILRRFAGRPLRDHVRDRALTTDELLALGLRLTRTLAVIHEADFVVRALEPGKILVHPLTGETCLIGFGEARTLGEAGVEPVARSARGLHYAPPEERICLDWSLDARSDLYALGTILYELATAQTPFREEDPTQVARAALTAKPESPSQINPTLPLAISRLILRLIQPRPEARYLSARDLEADIVEFQGQLQRYGSIEDEIALAVKSETPALVFWDRLQERSAEAESLVAAFERTRSVARSFVPVLGPAGSGKTALAESLRAVTVRSAGRFVRVACDPLDLNAPFAVVRHALEGLIDQVVVESEEALASWRENLVGRLGALADVAGELVPGLRRILPDLEPTSCPRPSGAARRTARALGGIVEVFASPEQPLVLVLEELQWADPGSLALLESLIGESGASGLLVIGTYRPDGIGAQMERLLAELTSYGAAHPPIELGELSIGGVEKMLGPTLPGLPRAELQTLAEYVGRAARWPLHVQVRVRGLVRSGALVLDASGEWRLREDMLSGLVPGAVLDDVYVDLSPESLRVLQVASALGADIRKDELEAHADLAPEALARAVARLCDAGVLSSTRRGVRFASAALFEAAGRLWAQGERASFDRGLAEHALETFEAQSDSTWAAVFRVVARLDRAAGSLDPDLAARSVRVRLMAAQRALVCGATRSAEHYAREARALLASHPETDSLLIEASCILSMASLAEGGLEAAEGSIEHLLSLDVPARELASVASGWIASLVQMGDRAAAVALGLRVCERLEIRIPSEPGKSQVKAALKATRRKLAAVSADDFACVDVEGDGVDAATTLLIATLARAAHLFRPRVATWAACLATQAMIDEGLVRSGPAVIAILAQGLVTYAGDPDSAGEVGQLALELSSRLPDPHDACETQANVCIGIQPWVTHRRKAIDTLRKLCDHAVELTDPAYASYVGLSSAFISFVVGEPLKVVERRVTDVIDVGSPSEAAATAMRDLIRALYIDEVVVPASDAPTEDSDPMELLARTIGAVSSFLLGRFEEAYELCEWEVERLAEGLACMPHVTERCLFSGLAAASLASVATGRRARHFASVLKKSLAQMRAWVKIGPDNFEHQALLLEAELARLKGQERRALTLYAQASDYADAQGYRHHAAIAHQRRATLAIDAGLMGEAGRFMAEAIQHYDEWGASVLARRLSDSHSDLLSSHGIPGMNVTTTVSSTVRLTRTTTVSATSTHEKSSTLDLTTVLRSSEAISGEVELARVIERVLGIAIENAGAQRAILLLDYDGELRVQSEGGVSDDAQTISEPIPLDEARDLLPVNLVQYVQRTRRSVVLRDASSDGLFVDDAYVSEHQVRSVLCVPILRQGRLVGVLYLENGLVTDAFTENRVEVLKMLSSQAAISLDNARLYTELTELNRDLELRIQDRTERLREARDAAEAATRAKSEFLAVMSHEIRTPMNVVIGMAQLMMDMNLTSDQQDCVRAIHTAGDSLLSVINDILDFSKIEAGKLELEHTEFGLRRCIEEVSEILAPKALDKGLEFPVFVDRRIPEHLQGDPNRLKQIIVNFVNNAIKFTERGYVEIHVSPIEEVDDCTRIRVEVRDTGIGIPASRIDRLFQSFSQVDASTTRKYGGTGLGLVISKRLAESMDGRVGVESTEGEGSTFWFEALFGLQQGVSDDRPSIADARALVAVAHAESARGLAEQIHTFDVRADVATTPAEALAAIEGATGEDAYTAVFVRYPFDDEGFAREVEKLQDVEGVSIFALATIKDRNEAKKRFGAKGVVTRPVKSPNVFAALATSIGVDVGPGEQQVGAISDAQREARARFRILVAEDYALSRKLAIQMLSRAGYACDVVEDGQKVIDAVEGGSYDVILMDCHMPEVDGFTATRRIRASEEGTGAHVPIIAMTANAMKGDRERCLDAGMDDYLSKPIQLTALYELLEKYLPSEV